MEYEFLSSLKSYYFDLETKEGRKTNKEGSVIYIPISIS
jgi:hypothetical protein